MNFQNTAENRRETDMLPSRKHLLYIYQRSGRDSAISLAVYFLNSHYMRPPPKLPFKRPSHFALIIVAATILFIPAYGAKLELAISVFLRFSVSSSWLSSGMTDCSTVDALFLFLYFSPRNVSLIPRTCCWGPAFISFIF